MLTYACGGGGGHRCVTGVQAPHSQFSLLVGVEGNTGEGGGVASGLEEAFSVGMEAAGSKVCVVRGRSRLLTKNDTSVYVSSYSELPLYVCPHTSVTASMYVSSYS